MGPFRFRLAKVLHWRDSQCQIEQSRLAAAHAALNQKDQELRQLLAAQIRAERALLARPSIPAGELQALEECRRRDQARQTQLRQALQQCQRQLDLQIERFTAARAKLQVLEKLREHRLAEHADQVNRELEQLATETYLAKYARDI